MVSMISSEILNKFIRFKMRLETNNLLEVTIRKVNLKMIVLMIVFYIQK